MVPIRVAAACLLLCAALGAAAQPFDLVIANGRVMGPESGLMEKW
ncbi:MAG TPA: hypothetical protein VIA64_03875 [Burkholderiales bacterium]